jgi:nucleoside-diphosphate-sugar epimerase
MYVFGFPRGAALVNEDCAYRPYGGEYGRSKAKMERWCLRRAESAAATRIVVLNPTCVFGPRGGAYTRLPIELARRHQFCWIDGGAGLCNYTYVENLVDALILAAEQIVADGKRFIISDGAISWREFLEPLLAPLRTEMPTYSRAELKARGREQPEFSLAEAVNAIVSNPEVRRVFKRSSLVRRLHGMVGTLGPRGSAGNAALPAPFANPIALGRTEACPPPWLCDLYPGYHVQFSSRRASETLGWSPRIPLKLAQERTVSWLRDAGFYGDVATD